jgi:hypothetical protein
MKSKNETSAMSLEELRSEVTRLRAALIDLEDEVRILLRDNDLEVTEGLSCAIDIARDAIAKADQGGSSNAYEGFNSYGGTTE